MLSGAFITPHSKTNSPGKTDLFFNLSAFASGRCQVLVNNVVVQEFYYTPDASSNVFGVIELFLSSAIQENYRLVESDRSLQQQKPRLSVVFNNRETLWRYHFLMQPHSPLSIEMAAIIPLQKTVFLSQLNVVAKNDPGITFSQHSVTDLSIEFVSDSALRLQEKYFSSASGTEPLSLELEKFSGTPDPVAIKTNLPLPLPGRLNATNFPNLYSDIFITI